MMHHRSAGPGARAAGLCTDGHLFVRSDLLALGEATTLRLEIKTPAAAAAPAIVNISRRFIGVLLVVETVCLPGRRPARAG
jgi:hypothetical protein